MAKTTHVTIMATMTVQGIDVSASSEGARPYSTQAISKRVGLIL